MDKKQTKCHTKLFYNSKALCIYCVLMELFLLDTADTTAKPLKSMVLWQEMIFASSLKNRENEGKHLAYCKKY